ncbi:MAG: hypothetical protein QG641_2232 [Candidatus Poribacteria bacterium]|nr:hypothetical protein [Candidatus Poribacteria bacterium]MDQ1328946.1 hypothetical protein [Candidatus Poribacteria bacterium]
MSRNYIFSAVDIPIMKAYNSNIFELSDEEQEEIFNRKAKVCYRHSGNDFTKR